jgi:hypothetical protein
MKSCRYEVLCEDTYGDGFKENIFAKDYHQQILKPVALYFTGGVYCKNKYY